MPRLEILKQIYFWYVGDVGHHLVGSFSEYFFLCQALWDKFMKERETETVKEKEYDCPPNDDVSYYLPDEAQCDKYLECNIKGELREHLCPDGFVFDINQEKCDYPVKVNCTGRDLLRE